MAVVNAHDRATLGYEFFLSFIRFEGFSDRESTSVFPPSMIFPSLTLRDSSSIGYVGLGESE